MSGPQTNFTFEDTLTQIGLGYPILFLLGFRPPRWQWIALGGDPDRLLAGVGVVSRRGSGFRLSGRRRARRLAASLHGLRRALEQERESRERVRPVVPQPVSANQAVRRQQRRLSHAELHSDARHDDPGPGRGTMAARGRAEDSVPATARGRRHRHGRGLAAARHRNLSGSEAHLDAKLDVVQRRPVLLLPVRLLLADRNDAAIASGRSRCS